jgi:hypothetical protein
MLSAMTRSTMFDFITGIGGFLPTNDGFFLQEFWL